MVNRFVWWTVVGSAVLTIGAIGWEVFAPPRLPHLSKDRVDILPGLLIGIGIILALLTYQRDSYSQEQERQRKFDDMAFEAASAGLDQVVKLLQGPNNDRINWLHAARLLMKSQELAESIVTQHTKNAMIIEIARTRYELFNMLQCDTPDGLASQCLPPGFFLGDVSWEGIAEGEKSFFEAFVRTDSTTTAGWMGLNIINPEPELHHLPLQAVVAVYEFIAQNSWTDDPLSEIDSWENEVEDIMPGIDQGARQYVYAKQRYYVDDGAAKDFSKPDGT